MSSKTGAPLVSPRTQPEGKGFALTDVARRMTEPGEPIPHALPAGDRAALMTLSPKLRAALLALAPLVDELRREGAALPDPPARPRRRAASPAPPLPPRPAFSPDRQAQVTRALKRGGYSP